MKIKSVDALRGILFLLVFTVNCMAAELAVVTEYDNSTIEGKYRTKMIEMVLFMISIEDKLTEDQIHQVWDWAGYILDQTPQNEERVFPLEAFYSKYSQQFNQRN